MAKSKYHNDINIDDLPPIVEYKSASDKIVVETGLTLPMLVRKLMEAMSADEVTVEYEQGEEVRRKVRTDWRTRMEALQQCMMLLHRVNLGISAVDDSLDVQHEEHNLALAEASKYYAVKLLEKTGVPQDVVIGSLDNKDDDAQ